MPLPRYRLWEDNDEVFDENDASIVVVATTASAAAELAHSDRFKYKREKYWIVRDEADGSYRQITTSWGDITTTKNVPTTLKDLKDE